MGQVVASPVIEQIRSDKLDHYWKFISEEMDRIPHVWADWWTKDAIYWGITSGFMQIWAAGNGTEIHVILITQIAEYPASRVLQCILTFGNKVDLYLDALAATMENFGRSRGCSSCDVWGRKGWERKLAKFPGAQTKVIVSFPIPQERVH